MSTLDFLALFFFMAFVAAANILVSLVNKPWNNKKLTIGFTILAGGSLIATLVCVVIKVLNA